MQLHELKLIHKNRRKRRVGRGGKRGTYSGRGLKGQKSRAGRRIRPAMRDLISRIPKRRGFKNKPKKSPPLTLNIKNLLWLSGKVDLSRLKQEQIIPNRYRGEVKIVGKALVKNSIVLSGIKISRGAKISIEKAGGKVEGFVQKSKPSGE